MVVPPVTPDPASSPPGRMLPDAIAVTVRVVVVIDPVKTAAGKIVVDAAFAPCAAPKSIIHVMESAAAE